MNTEKVYENTLNILVKAFENGWNDSSDIEAAITVTMKAIPSGFSEEYQEALGNACIEAASLIDVERVADSKAIIKAFEDNLDNELAHLLSGPSPTM